MSPRWVRTSALGVLLTACTAAPGRPAPEAVPGAGADRAETAPAPAPAPVPQRRHTPGDVRFMQGMIAHHRQALEMAALVPARASRDDVRRLGQRVEVSQQDEIDRMERWLRDRGEEVPGPHAHHGTHAGMPGMATPEEMARLAAATGAEFDRLLLELMIRHHQGALAMVAELFATPGAGQEPEIFQFAADVDADQRMEIDRMRRMLEGPLS